MRKRAGAPLPKRFPILQRLSAPKFIECTLHPRAHRASAQREQTDQLSFPHFAALENSSGTPYASIQRVPTQGTSCKRQRFTAIDNRCAGPMPPTIHNAEYFRDRSREAIAQAEQMSDPEAKRELLEIAATYERLAKLAEDEPS
jgi:hypothetical protein